MVYMVNSREYCVESYSENIINKNKKFFLIRNFSIFMFSFILFCFLENTILYDFPGEKLEPVGFNHYKITDRFLQETNNSFYRTATTIHNKIINIKGSFYENLYTVNKKLHIKL